MCCCLQDLLEQAKDEEDASAAQLLPHPADEKYGTLKADLKVVNPSEQEYQVVDQYVKVRPLLPSCCSIGTLQTPISRLVLWRSGRTVGTRQTQGQRQALRGPAQSNAPLSAPSVCCFGCCTSEEERSTASCH